MKLQCWSWQDNICVGAAGNVRITEKRRLATAAAAINERIVNRRSPLVFLPVLPLKKGSDIVSDIVDDD
jgi:hypothetical protein